MTQQPMKTGKRANVGKAPPTPGRQLAERAGRRAETAAAWYLRLKGYRILSRRFRVSVGEIDLVARRGRVLAFVEVKARATADQGRAAVTPWQQRRVIGAAAMFIALHPDLAGLDQRFDLITVVRRQLPTHDRAAWRADDLSR